MQLLLSVYSYSGISDNWYPGVTYSKCIIFTTTYNTFTDVSGIVLGMKIYLPYSTSQWEGLENVCLEKLQNTQIGQRVNLECRVQGYLCWTTKENKSQLNKEWEKGALTDI